MFKKLTLTLVAGAALTAASTAAFAQWAFDNPYWKQQLDRSGEPSVFDQFAGGPRDTKTDATVELRLTDDGRVTAIEAEKARRDSAGFPQYTN
jgi:hypothetical protein